jgi:hypothetical protein
MSPSELEFGAFRGLEALGMAKKSKKQSGAKTRGNGSAAAAAIPVVQTPSPVRSNASPADVSARAHQIWIARGKPTPGTPLEDWLQAERELGLSKRG